MSDAGANTESPASDAGANTESPASDAGANTDPAAGFAGGRESLLGGLPHDTAVTTGNIIHSDQLGGKIALITGGSNGIGAGVARRLAAGGAKVVVVDIDDAAGKDLAHEIDGLFVHADVTDLDANKAAVAAAVEHFGRLDLVHLNAGISSGCGLDDDFDLVRYRLAMGINLDGVVFGVHATLPALRAGGGGTIVATASMAGIVGIPGDPIYAANKHAVVGLVRSLGPTLQAEGIKVQGLCPSFADTAILGSGKELLEEAGFPILDVSDVVDAFIQLLDSDQTGECWFVVPGRESQPFGFRRAPGPRA